MVEENYLKIPGPVSYTHLDVYKRQIYSHIQFVTGESDSTLFNSQSGRPGTLL